MALPVYDYHRDIKNFLITPEIRMRFYRMDVGQVDARHSHDLGHEIFLILEGRCEMEIEGERAVLEPGQACVARRDQMHQARNVGDTPVIMYLSVSPHVLPTHTFWTADPRDGGKKLPARYELNYLSPEDRSPGLPTLDLVDLHVAAVQRVAAMAASAAAAHEQLGSEYRGRIEKGDVAVGRNQIDRLWSELLPLLQAVSALEASWNDLAPRVATTQSDP